jgi:short-subunit dehydrogenase
VTPWERALVTGASAGIGEAFARRLAAQGSNLVLVARRVRHLEALASELETECDIETEVLVADLTTSEGIRAVEHRLQEATDPIDLLVNNAGGSAGTGRGAFANHERRLLEDQMVLNALSVMRLTHAAVQAMRERGRGNVIQVSGGTAFYPVPFGAVYSASKAFVNSFSEAINDELRGSGVTVTVVCPGFTRTEAPARIGFTEENVPSWWWSDPEEVVQVALHAAARNKVVCSPKAVNRLNANVGRHFPRAMMRLSARMTK